MPAHTPLAQVAVYHPWPLLTPQPLSVWAKNMMLFFDQVALVAPPSAANSLSAGDEATVAPLTELGLFRFMDPGDLVDETVANQILAFLLEAATAPNARRPLEPPKDSALSAWSEEWDVHGMLSWSRIRPNHYGVLSRERNRDPRTPTWGVVYEARSGRGKNLVADESVLEAAEMIWRELFRKGLAVEKTGLHPLLLHPSIWATLEALLVHALRPAGRNIGLELHPCTGDLTLIAETIRITRASLPPSQADVISSDLSVVGPDLSDVPLDEILTFRSDHGKQYRDYAAALHTFMAELVPMSGDHRLEAFRQRKAQLEDAAEDLRRISRRSWRQPAASIAVGIAGATWAAIQGDVPSALIALIGGAVGANLPGKELQGTYSYFFEAQRSLAR